MAAPAGPMAGTRRDAVGLVELLFLGAVLLAPMDVLIVQSFTAHDLLMGGILLCLIFQGRPLHRLPSALGPAVYVFLLAALVSTFRATHPMEALTQGLQFAFIFFVQIPVVLTVVRSRFLIHAAVVAFLVGSLIPVAVSIGSPEVTTAHRYLPFYGDNPNRLGYPAAYLAPFVLLLFLIGWRARWRITALLFAGGSLYLLAWALAASASRGAAVGAILAPVLFLVCRDGLRSRWRAMGRLVVAATLIGTVGFALSRSEYFPSTLRDRIRESLDPTAPEEQRWQLNEAGMRAFSESPLVGTGLDNFRHVSQQYGGSRDQAPHNMWIQFLAQVGLFGALAMLAIMALWFVWILRAASAAVTAARQWLLWAFLASMAAVMAIYMNTPLMIQRHYWLIFGLGLAAAVRVPEEIPLSDPLGGGASLNRIPPSGPR